MKIVRLAIVVSAVLLCNFAFTAAVAENKPDEAKPADANSAFKTDKEKISYAFGTNIGRSLKDGPIKDEITLDIFIQGIKDSAAGGKMLMSPEEIKLAQTNFQKYMQAKQAAETAKMPSKEQNKTAGDQFLAENKKKEGVVTLPSGLQYQVIKEGTGAMPKATDTVTTHYKGTLIDGTVFDSSIDRGEPAQFPVNGVIKGWIEALQLMKVGSKWKLFIPSDLAYGDHGAPPKIGANAVLIFEIELISIDK